ncbi:hypothetical protein GCM10009742_72710 [Kribbella karoonensis]|uniref:Uncharacterized protein n=1 Tax=Kribbella karoonensis TaxID=324851 RepID=A0ABN2EMJ0_9ACTN
MGMESKLSGHTGWGYVGGMSEMARDCAEVVHPPRAPQVLRAPRPPAGAGCCPLPLPRASCELPLAGDCLGEVVREAARGEWCMRRAAEAVSNGLLAGRDE